MSQVQERKLDGFFGNFTKFQSIELLPVAFAKYKNPNKQYFAFFSLNDLALLTYLKGHVFRLAFVSDPFGPFHRYLLYIFSFIACGMPFVY